MTRNKYPKVEVSFDPRTKTWDVRYKKNWWSIWHWKRDSFGYLWGYLSKFEALDYARWKLKQLEDEKLTKNAKRTYEKVVLEKDE